eukprot:1159382-Pelagomonas_calceolata.AAC.1
MINPSTAVHSPSSPQHHFPPQVTTCKGSWVPSLPCAPPKSSAFSSPASHLIACWACLASCAPSAQHARAAMPAQTSRCTSMARRASLNSSALCSRCGAESRLEGAVFDAGSNLGLSIAFARSKVCVSPLLLLTGRMLSRMLFP